MIADYLNGEIEIAAWTIASLKEHVPVLIEMADRIVKCLRAGGCVFTCGNGGSMAQAQHAVAELVGAFQNRGRSPFRAICLGTSAPTASALGNDFSFKGAMARELTGLAKEGDVLWCFSTSGESENVLAAADAGGSLLGLTVLSFTRDPEPPLAKISDLALCVTSDSTARIQEVHLLALHLVCGIIEQNSLEFADDSTRSA